MGRSYNAKDLKERLVELLQDSRTGLSGVEISERLGVSRVTITKYLGIFAAEGVINQKSIGNVTLWSVDEDVTHTHTAPLQTPQLQHNAGGGGWTEPLCYPQTHSNLEQDRQGWEGGRRWQLVEEGGRKGGRKG